MASRRRAGILVIAALSFLLSGVVAGCGAVHHTALFEGNFTAEPGVLVEVGSVTNATGRSYDIDIVRMLTDQLTTALRDEDLLWLGSSSVQPLASTLARNDPPSLVRIDPPLT
jgi:hypothetical protein